jgi:hypothetical protein
LTAGAIGPRRTGGEIFSKVKTGIVVPLVVELKHPWTSPRIFFLTTALASVPFKPV